MRRSEHAGILDPLGQQIVFFGGSLSVPENCSFPISTYEKETWIFDLTCERWRMIEGGPTTGRTRHSAVYDATEHRMLIFGGRYRSWNCISGQMGAPCVDFMDHASCDSTLGQGDGECGSSGPYTLYNEVWAFDLESETWSQVLTDAGPSPRVNAGVVYEAEGHRLIVFGGNASSSGMNYLPLNDTWILDLSSGTWSELPTTQTPSPRLFPSALWDPERDLMIIHGGADSGAFFQTAQYFDEVYALDLNTAAWTRLDNPANLRPDGRFWGGLVYDTMHDGYLLFGGHDDGNLGNRNDLWSFDPDTGMWIEIALGDTYNKPALDVCLFPPDFTNIDMNAPERRSAHIWVAGEDTVWLSGGKTDCGVVDDVMALDLAELTWTEIDTPTVGVSCLRKGGLTCNDLCF